MRSPHHLLVALRLTPPDTAVTAVIQAVTAVIQAVTAVIQAVTAVIQAVTAATHLLVALRLTPPDVALPPPGVRGGVPAHLLKESLCAENQSSHQK